MLDPGYIVNDTKDVRDNLRPSGESRSMLIGLPP